MMMMMVITITVDIVVVVVVVNRTNGIVTTVPTVTPLVTTLRKPN